MQLNYTQQSIENSIYDVMQGKKGLDEPKAEARGYTDSEIEAVMQLIAYHEHWSCREKLGTSE